MFNLKKIIMKKMFNKIGTLLLLAVAVIAVSCSNEEMDDLNVSKVENKGVIKELENVNLELLSTVSSDILYLSLQVF